MKKIVILLSALALTCSCVKESAPKTVIENEASLKITARLLEATPITKTSYEETEQVSKFSWLSTDLIDVQLSSLTNDDIHWHWDFAADEAGSTVTFSKTEGDMSSYKLATYAFYPKHSTSMDGRDLAYNIESKFEDVTISEESIVSFEELTSLVPLIGIRNSGTGADETESVIYDFKTATGVVRVDVKNVPSTAKAIRITSASSSDYLCGIVSLTDLADGEISMSDLKFEQKNTRTFRFGFTPSAGQSIIAYMPIPTGTFTGGFTVELLGAEDAQIISRTISEDVLIERNTVYYLPEIDLGTDWTSIGTGWFGDNYLFYQSSFNKIGRMAPVDIQQSNSDSNKYRIRDPYGSAASYLGVSLSGFHNSYLSFTLDGAGGVNFDDHKTGITYSGLNTLITDNSSSNNTVKYDLLTPKYVQLAPMYKKETSANSKDYSSDLSDRSSYTNIINIVFPNYSIGEAVSGNWAINSNTKFLITVEPVVGDDNYNIKITRYQNTNVSPKIDISGTCLGSYDPISGKITFAVLQEFADTGVTQPDGTYAGSRIVYSFRGKLSGATQDLVFSVQNQNATLITTSDTFCLDKYIVDYGNSGGYSSYQQFSNNPTFKKQ